MLEGPFGKHQVHACQGLNPLSQARKERAPGIPRDVMRGKALRASSP